MGDKNNKDQKLKQLIHELRPNQSLADFVGVNVEAVRKWSQRNSIPARYQLLVVKFAQSQGLNFVTADWMLAAHEVSS